MRLRLGLGLVCLLFAEKSVCSHCSHGHLHIGKEQFCLREASTVLPHKTVSSVLSQQFSIPKKCEYKFIFQ